AREELGILAGVDVIGDRRDVVAVAHVLAELVHQRRLAGADRAAHAHPQCRAHDLNNLVYWVSWRIEVHSIIGAAAPTSSGSRANASSAAAITAVCSEARMR